MRLVIIESPYAGDIERNLRYARACIRHSLLSGESPIASHVLYTQEGILDDSDPGERRLGIHAGIAWYHVANFCAVYSDFGISNGMMQGIEFASGAKIQIEFRTLPREIYQAEFSS